MSEEEHLFQKSNSCWIRKQFIDNDEKNSERSLSLVTGKFRGAAHQNCNVKFQLTKKVPVIFHNLRGYDSHLIFNELDKFDVKIKVIPNGLGKYMTFFLNKNLVFIDSMQFMNSSLDKLVKNLLGEDFKYLVEELDTCLKYYGLDPCHYFSCRGLSWDAMLKMTDIKLEKISGIDKYSSIEKGLRGGISYIAKRYAKANNKYINDYDPKTPSTFISYLDMNNLYGWVMSEYLPCGRFKWLKNIDKFDIMSISEKSLIGYFLEVDLEYPDQLHQLHNDYPLAPEKLAVSSGMLSKSW